MVEFGCVHGRFQPAHRDHLKYMLAAKERCKHLIVGITQFDNAHLHSCTDDPHRAMEFCNPLTYQERMDLIAVMLKEHGLSDADFSIIPFPIDEPEKIGQYLRAGAVCYTTIMDEWNLVKVDRLRKVNYEVSILWDERGKKTISATQIRDFAVEGNKAWEVFVTPAVKDFLYSLDFEGRLRTRRILAGTPA